MSLLVRRDTSNDFGYQHLKSSNILVDTSGCCKISDFRNSMSFHDGGDASEKQPLTPGNIFWMPPEAISTHKNYSVKIDIWSLGCVVLEMWTGQRPWSEQQVGVVQLQVCVGFIPQRYDLTGTEPVT